MKIIQDDEGNEFIYPGISTLDAEELYIMNVNGYGNCDIEINGHIITWDDVYKLIKALTEAEIRWKIK